MNGDRFSLEYCSYHMIVVICGGLMEDVVLRPEYDRYVVPLYTLVWSLLVRPPAWLVNNGWMLNEAVEVFGGSRLLEHSFPRPHHGRTSAARNSVK